MEIKSKSLVLIIPAANHENAKQFFSSKLQYETDPADVYHDMENGVDDFVLIDVRSPDDYKKSHAKGAINLPVSRINQKTISEYSDGKLVVVYCWGPGCNGATKAAAKLGELSIPVKEMIGGIEYWEDRERYPVERS